MAWAFGFGLVTGAGIVGLFFWSYVADYRGRK